jgi:hypothetical protein
MCCVADEELAVWESEV